MIRYSSCPRGRHKKAPKCENKNGSKKTLKNLKKIKKSLKKCLTTVNSLWYDIQAVAEEVAEPSCSLVKVA